MKEYTLLELYEGLNTGKVTSHELIDWYLEMINKYDYNGPKLNSLAEINPDAYMIADELDNERKVKGPRSILHGIPIVVKDNINTKDKMHTTAGSLALADLYAPYDATIISKLRAAGAIILGKTNMTEFAAFLSGNMPSGFSSRKGQVKNPYHETLDPLGSSSGSAVSVAANLIPVSIGTETNGSLMAPAQYNSIVSIKPTVGLVSRYGIIPISYKQDTAGPMGRTVKDCAIILDAIYGKDEHDLATLNINDQFDFINACDRDVKDKRLGFVTYTNRAFNEEEIKILDEAKSKLTDLGCIIVDITVEAKVVDCYSSMLYEFYHDLNAYLDSVKGYTQMTCLEDIIAFNEQEPKIRIPYGQTILCAARNTHQTTTSIQYQEIRNKVVENALQIEELMHQYQLDALISTKRTSHAPALGYPCISIPAKALNDLKPINIIMIGKMWDEETLFSLASAYERVTMHRIKPNLEG